MRVYQLFASKPKRISITLAKGAVLLLLASGAGCGQSSQGPSKVAVDPALDASNASAKVIKPEKKTIPLRVRQPGYVQAFEQTPMYAKIAGYVRKWNVDIDDHVSKGKVLAELYVPEMVEELNQKQEAVKQANEAFEVAKARVGSAAAIIKEAQAGVPRAEYNHQFWRQQFDRISKLEKTLTPQEKEETWNQLQSAAAAVKEAEAKVDTSQAKLREAEALKKKAEVDIGAAKADRDRLTALVGYTQLAAPYDGVVTRRNINTDDFVQPPTGGKGEPLYVVERHDKMRVVVEVPEVDASWVAKGAKAHIRIQALNWQEFSGQVARTSYSINRTARTLVAEIDLENREDRLRPGMYVVATITGEHRAGLALPVSAIAIQGDVTQGYQRYCFLVRGDKAERTLVQVGISDATFVEVLGKQSKSIEGGSVWEVFTGAEQVVADAAAVKDGQTVVSK
jgi:multidrug efflux pump subunit AcrA (membrane-fusion protein)